MGASGGADFGVRIATSTAPRTAESGVVANGGGSALGRACASIFAGRRRSGFTDRVISVQSSLSSLPNRRPSGSFFLRLVITRASPVLGRRLLFGVFCGLFTPHLVPRLGRVKPP